ncbi:MAG: CHAP domain-containing protein, partial [Clostridia bacterium]|nr:CHAP domain-containing protein [Clostridia bacterium]
MKKHLKAAFAVLLALVMALTAFPAFAVESAKEVETEQPQQLERGIEPKATSLEAASVQPMLTPVYTPSSYYQNGPYYNNLLNVQLTGNQRTDIVNVAVSQYGYHEGNSISDLGGGNTNGSNNYTEYGYWYGINVNGWSGGWYDSWCAMFVSWCARQAQIPTSILKNSAGAGHSSSYFNIPYYDGANYSPQVGDLFFHKDWTHVGLVKSVNGNTFETIEGNSSNKVTSRTLNRSNYYFGVPNYTSTPIAPPAAPTVGTDSYYYAAGSTVTISWNAVANNDFYWINVYKNGELIIDRSMGNDTVLSIPNAQAGGYWVNLSANNSAGGNGSSCEFVVVSSAPEAPIVTTDSTMYAVGSSVTVSWNAVENNQYYWTNVYRNGEVIYDSGLGNDTSFTLTDVQPGNYTVL